MSYALIRGQCFCQEDLYGTKQSGPICQVPLKNLDIGRDHNLVVAEDDCMSRLAGFVVTQLLVVLEGSIAIEGFVSGAVHILIT